MRRLIAVVERSNGTTFEQKLTLENTVKETLEKFSEVLNGNKEIRGRHNEYWIVDYRIVENELEDLIDQL